MSTNGANQPEGRREDADHLVAGLDEAQGRAVTLEATPLAILAGAGSGKTRVLTRRIAWRALTGAEDPRRTLALTFTRKAAGELRSRLRRLGLRDQVAAGTFHSVAYAQLRIFWRDRNLPEPKLVDRKIPVVTELIPRDSRATDTLDVVSEIEWAKARRIRPEAYTRAAESVKRTPPLPLPVVARIYQEYEELKADRGMVDFDDLLDQCARVVRGDRAFGDAQRWRFRHLYVDEFQDVNPLQFALLTAWLGGSSDLCVVGDPNQAIYGWNGANADYLVNFTSHFHDAHVVELNQNYRSTPEILRTAAAALVDGNPMEAVRPGGGKPSIARHDDEQAEALAIARRARKNRGPSGRWMDQAVLVRTNAQTVVIADALREAGIPVHTRMGSSLLDRADVRAMLKALSTGTRPLDEWLADLTHQPSDDEPEGPLDEDRGSAYAELRRLAEEYRTLDPGCTASGFSVWVRSQARGAEGGHGDSVEVATFHAAKGLEWPIVHLAGLEKGLVPISHATEPTAIAEERRLLYVALTRAERSLHCSWAGKRRFGDRISDRSPSPWLEDLAAAIEALERPLQPTDQSSRARAARRRTGRPHLPDTPGVTALREWRKTTARAADVPAFVVFSDLTLEALLRHQPATRADLLNIPGIGPVKADLYGEALLDLLARLN
ncbi:MAG: ATP-dependent DNA helicase UvrD2 [Actinomycetota bacterium]|nr:ATP-dependent DNA helicase UvrD2 [Actinomycetota bacterium]